MRRDVVHDSDPSYRAGGVVTRRRLIYVVLTVAAAGGAAATAYVLADGTGGVQASSDAVPTATAPTPAAAGRDVTLTWRPSRFSDGTVVTGYVASRYARNAKTSTRQFPCAGTVNPAGSVTCTDVGVAPGSWTYTVATSDGGWSGVESAQSAVVTIGTPTLTTPSSITAGTPTTVTASNFLDNETVTVHLGSAAGSIVGSGIVSAGTPLSIVVTLPSGTPGGNSSLVAVASPSGDTATAAVKVLPGPCAMTSMLMQDTNNNGKIDTVVVTFNQTLQPDSAGTAGWTLANVPSNGSLATVTVKGNAATLALTEGANAPDTGLGAFTIALAEVPGGIHDANNNFAAFNATAPTDGAAPVMTSMSMLDRNNNGRVDDVDVFFSERVNGTAPSQWTLKNVPSGGTLSGVTTTNTTVVSLAVAEGALAPDTSVGRFTLALSGSATGVHDAAGNTASFAATAPVDRAAPAMTSLVMSDTASAGFINQVTATFSETLSGPAGAFQWLLGNTPSGQFVSGVTLAGNQAVVALTPAAGATPNTGPGMTVRLVASSNGIKDAAGNAAGFAATAAADRAGPAVVAMSTQPAVGSPAGLLAPGASLTLTFSEPVTGVPSTPAITEAAGGSKANDTLSITGITNGALDLGSTGYLTSTKNGTAATFAATVTLSNNGTTVTITAGACTSATCPVAASSGAFTFRPAVGITDAATNPADGAETASSFPIF